MFHVTVDERQRADVAQRAAGRHLGDELREVLGVAGMVAGVTGRTHSGTATQGLGLDAGVVGDRGDEPTPGRRLAP